MNCPRSSVLGYRVWGLWFGVRGLGCVVWGVECGVWGLRFGVWGLEFEVLGLGFPTSSRNTEKEPLEREAGSGGVIECEKARARESGRELI